MMPGLPMPGTGPGASQLDGPPPNPALGPGMNPGTPLGQAVTGQKPSAGPVPSSQLPIPVLTGMQQAADSMNTMLDAFAQIAPDLAPDALLVKQALAAFMSKVQAAGAGPTAPTATGTPFPGGGMDQQKPTVGA
jgi:hypothetical protein